MKTRPVKTLVLLARMLLYLSLFMAAAGLRSPIRAQAEPPSEHFYRKVLPVLRAKCFQCHGPNEQEAGLRLDSREALLAGGDNGRAVDPEDVGASLLLQAVRAEDGVAAMPPDEKDRLSNQQIAELTTWIADGTQWPRPAMVLFEDEPALAAALAEGSGPAELDTSDVHSGTAALVVGPQRFAANIDGWRFPIAKNPGPGEYRYLRFAWKKRGGGGIMFELANDGQWRTEKRPNAAWSAGRNTTGWDAVSLGDDRPSEWTVVTRDLWADRGDWEAFSVTGFCLTAIDGGEALIDSIVLGPSLASLDAYIPRDADRAQFALPQPRRRLGDAWTDKENPVVRAFHGQRLDLWSLKSVERPALPEIGNKAWAKSPIDRFVSAGLEAAGLQPSDEADRHTLIRRLTFDLTGLPPTPEEVDAFVGDKSPTAYDDLVERLLSSKHYGEHWGRHWLDVVRYADTEGFERDEFRPTIYRYRDYVIRSFNADKPYNRFLQEQLAGDELVAGGPIDKAAADALLATGFLRLGPRDTTAEIFEENAVARDQLLGDLANTAGEAFLGLTMSCCQCHDHKYDPLLQADHFRLRAFFSAVKQDDELPISTDRERAEIDKHNQTVEAELRPLREKRDVLLETGREQVRSNRGPANDVDVNEDDALKALSEDQRKQHKELSGQIAEIEKRKRTYATGWCATDSGSQPPAVHILFQGDVNQPRDEVQPGFLSIIDPNPADIPPAASAATTGRRTALAAWITSPENTFTARVMVNRIWQHHFGRGIVATPNDFGFTGARPTHPELLDWLAAEFVECGWSIKHMHRLIVKSKTYRQASRFENPLPSDPNNQLLWRQNPRRLDAESLRDALLAVSGELLPVDSGPPKWPAIPEFIRRSNPATLDDNGRLQNWYTTTPEEETYVRSVFTIHKRTIPIPFLQPFDLPDSTRSCARRDVTIVAPQASTLMNSPFALAMADKFAVRIDRSGDNLDSRIRSGFRLALARQADDEELAAARELLMRHTKVYIDAGRERPSHDALVDFCRALFNANEFNYID